MCSGGKSLEFRPKAHKKDVDSYVDACRTKFGCFESDGLDDDLTGNVVSMATVAVHVHFL